MVKKSVAAWLFIAGSTAFAGFVNQGDNTGFPGVSGARLKRIISWKHFPDNTRLQPKGLSRRQAWTGDIKKAAEKLNIAPEKLDEFIKFVLAPGKSDVVAAPHEKLLEFELYARGIREFDAEKDQMSPSWEKLLALPLEQRLYTTIPVMRAYCRHARCSLKYQEEALEKMIASRNQGCLDTQGCILDLIKDIERNPRDYFEWATAYRMLFRKESVNSWELRYRPEYKDFNFSDDAVKTIISPDDVWYDLLWALYTESEENLRTMCKNDPVMRDLIVCLGLTNRRVPKVTKVAWEFYRESVINYPAAAVKLPLDEAVELLNDHPEYHDIRDQLIIRSLSGEEKIRAIDRYIAKYPDFSSDKFDNDAMKYKYLYSHAHLHALAGTELFKMGRPYEAAERWINGCTPEDMGMVAEQVMSIEELKAFCDKHFPQPEMLEQEIYSASCDREQSFFSYAEIVNKKQLNFMLRNLLARRLMRAGRFEEARKYFTGDVTRSYVETFFILQAIVDSTASTDNKVAALLKMAALVRFHGDKIFGTFLEPDNLISKNRFPCQWGTRQTYVKLNKPDLPRYSYRYRAAELYAKAAGLTNDKYLKAKALWAAGTLLKNRAPEIADTYFKKLVVIAPDLTVNNWFAPLSKTYFWNMQEFYNNSGIYK